MMTEQFSDILIRAINARLNTIHTALPARVDTYNPTNKTISATPEILKKMPDGTVLNFPQITDIPVIFPGTNNFILHFPLEVGDKVLLVFSERSIDNYMQGQTLKLPDDPRKFDLSDAIAIPGFFPKASPGKASADSTAVTLQFKDAKIEIDTTGNIKLNGETKTFVTHTELNTALQAFITALNLHVHTATALGSPTTPPVTPLSLDISAAQTTTVKTGG